MHKFFTAATQSSGVLCAPPVLPDPPAGAPNVPVGVSRWLTRTACAAHLCQCGFGFAIRTVRASHRLAPTSLRDENLCIIRASGILVLAVLAGFNPTIPLNVGGNRAFPFVSGNNNRPSGTPVPSGYPSGDNAGVAREWAYFEIDQE